MEGQTEPQTTEPLTKQSWVELGKLLMRHAEALRRLERDVVKQKVDPADRSS